MQLFMSIESPPKTPRPGVAAYTGCSSRRATLLSDSDAFLADYFDRPDVAGFGVFVACLRAAAKGLPGAPFGKHLLRVGMMSRDTTKTHAMHGRVGPCAQEQSHE